MARGGIAGSVTYSAEVSGIPPRPMRALCHAMASAAPIQAVGASLGARLALGGDQAADADPRVLFHNLPLKFVMGWLWENAEARQAFVVSWYLLRDRSRGWGASEWWRNVRGPLSAAWAHLVAAGMEWVSPFAVRSRGLELSFLEWAPFRTYQLLAEHVRIRLDAELLVRHAEVFQCDIELVLGRYKHGIDWAVLRELIASSQSPLDSRQRRALSLVATDSLWEEQRKWLAGYLPSGTCLLCLSEQGCKEHRLQLCPGVVHALDWAWVGGDVPREPAALAELALAPLRLFGWLPAPVERVLAPVNWIQGSLPPGIRGNYFGDGSCLWPQKKACEAGAWSLVCPDIEPAARGLSASLLGPFVNSFRGELSAAIQFFRVAGPASQFVGDCKSVVDAIQLGVPRHLVAAASRDADLWLKLRQAVRKRSGDALEVKWTKAHRARETAARLGQEALREWAGNREADELARAAAARHADASRVEGAAVAACLAKAALTRLAFAAATGLERCADLPRRRLKRARQPLSVARPGGHDPVALRSGGWRCKRCRVHARTKASLRTFRAVPCKGSFAARAHVSHRLRVTQGVVWCGRCGAYAVEKVVGLARECPGHPVTAASAQRLLLLRNGHVPGASEKAARRLCTLAD